MSGALNLLRKIIMEGGPAARDLERRIGEMFMGGAQREGTFTQGREFAKTKDGLEQQFGVRIDDSAPGGSFVYTGNPSDGPSSMTFSSMSQLKPGSEVSEAVHFTPEELAEFPDDGRFGSIDTSFLRRSGGGKQAYGAMYGMLANDPRAYNFTNSLTGRNAHRRNYNQSSAVMRDPRLAERIMVDPKQMAVGERVRPAEFRRRAPEDQVGALQAQGALETLRRFDATIADPGTYPDRRGILEMLRDKRLSSERPSGTFHSMVRELRNSGASDTHYDTLGAGALKRAALVSDLVEGREVNPELFLGLEYRRGGIVRSA